MKTPNNIDNKGNSCKTTSLCLYSMISNFVLKFNMWKDTMLQFVNNGVVTNFVVNHMHLKT